MAGEEITNQGNVKPEYNIASTGMNMDNSITQVPKGSLTYALNASVENFDANSVNYQNEPGNEFCVQFPIGYQLIGTHFINEQNKHIFFLANPFGDSQIGYMDNNDCVYRIYIEATCLNFNVDYPIHKIVHKITNCTTEIYWTDGYNPRRYLDLSNIPYILTPGTNLCDPVPTDQVDCNQLKLQPNFEVPQLDVTDVTTGGALIAGTYQFAIQYSDALGNAYTSYYSVTNPTPIADIQVTTANFNYEVGKSIVLSVSNLDSTGQFQYFNIAVIKTVNAITSVELVGTYFIDRPDRQITYTGQNVTQIKLTINDIFEKYPYYEIAQDLTTVQDILVWDNLTSIDRINYQSIASQISLQWQTYRIPASENYSDELNATNLRGYLRDEVYAFEIVFLLKNGKQTDGFHIPGRVSNQNDISLVYINNPDFIGEPTPGTNNSPNWKIYNTATTLGIGTGDPIGNATPYEYGNFAYWESTELYPCNSVWGDLADTPIRHHKFPDISVSPAFEANVPAIVAGKFEVTMHSSDAVFPIGVKLDVAQVKLLIANSSLTQGQKDDIVAFKIVRGDRGTNKSIVAKGILRNVGAYTREDQTLYYPNYPYNDLTEDPFILKYNNAYLDKCTSWTVIPLSNGTYEYTDCNTNKTLTKPMIKGQTQLICSSTKPRNITGGASIGPSDYDLWFATGCNHGQQLILTWQDPFTQSGGTFTQYNNYSFGGNNFLNCFSLPSPSIRPYVIRVLPGDTPSNNSAFTPDYFDLHLIQKVRVSNTCGSEVLLPPIADQVSARDRFVFNSPETSFGQPFLGNVLKLENVLFGAGRGHHIQVKKNANYKLLTKEAQQDALTSSADLGAVSGLGADFNAAAMFTAYQAYLTIYINGITRKNYAYSYNSIASYDYLGYINNNLGIKQREIQLKQYLIPGVQSAGDNYNINNYQRESSVYVKVFTERFGIPYAPLPFPNKTPSIIDSLGNSLISDLSRFTISSVNNCATPAKERDITVVSYYASMKNAFVNQWGQMYSYETIDTGFQRSIDPIVGNPIATLFGGDTFISKFAFKTKLPFFFDNRVNAPDDSDIFYDEIGNVAYPKYWHSSRSILADFVVQNNNNTLLSNVISYKAHNFDCPNSQTPKENNPNRTFYDGYFYLFAYGIPSFYCESSYNTDLRQAFNNKEGDFWPHVNTSIPDDWVQESFVSIAYDNTYYYNITFSKQNKENYFSHLPADWKEQLCFTNFPFRAIYSEAADANPDNRVNSWLNYSATATFDFPQNYGKLTSLDGIQNRAVLARFENKSLLYNTMLTVSTSNPQAAYLGNDTLFKSSPPIDFAETDLGYVGSQNKMLLKIPQGQITIDAKRGQVFLITGNQATDLSAFGSGMNRFFTDHLAFEILRSFPTVDVDNHFNGVGLHGVYDSKYDRVIISKLDYIPLSTKIYYVDSLREFYIDEAVGNTTITRLVRLTDAEYFCNKSWTLSFNMNTKSWISFHSYIPNWYIGENNFFYSGLNGCCDDLHAIAVNELPPTTITTTTKCWWCRPGTSTTTTTIVVDCDLRGTAVKTDCVLEGTAVITIPPATTTTICQRPAETTLTYFISGYTISTDPETITSDTLEDACNGVTFIQSLPEDFTDFTYSGFCGAVLSLELGQPVYYDCNTTDCILAPDGYYSQQSVVYNNFIYHVEGGIIVSIDECFCGTTTTTTTLLNVPVCCGVLLSTVGGGDFYFNVNNNTYQPLGITGTIVANTENKLWIYTGGSSYDEYDITLSPFTATLNVNLPWPSGTLATAVALTDTSLLVINSTPSPQEVSIFDITGNTLTTQFTLQADRYVSGNLLYTTTGRIVVPQHDGISGDYFITQYIDLTGTIELDINVGAIIPIAIFECDCNMYIVGEEDGVSKLYLINQVSPYSIVFVSDMLYAVSGASQVASCVTDTFNTARPTTTTTTTTANPFALCLAVNPTFTTNLDGWSYDMLGEPQWAWSTSNGGSAVFIGSDVYGCISQDILTIGYTYRITFDLTIIDNPICPSSSRAVRVYTGTTGTSSITTLGTSFVDVTLTCTDNNTFCIAGYDSCSYGEVPGHVDFIFIDNVCVIQTIPPPTTTTTSTTIQNFAKCIDCAPVLNGVIPDQLGLLSTGAMTSSTCTLGDYVIDWYLDSIITPTQPSFASANVGNTTVGIAQFHPFSIPSQGGSWIPVIRYAYLDSVKYTSELTPGVAYASDLAACLAPINVLNLNCIAPTVGQPGYNAPANGATQYSHRFAYVNSVSLPADASKTLGFDLNSDGSTNYLAWRFDGLTISDRITFTYVSPFNSTSTVLQDYVIGSDVPNDWVNTPRKYQSTSYKYVIDFSAITYATGDYILINIVSGYIAPTNPNTNWTVYLKCLEVFDTSWTRAVTDVCSPVMTYNTGLCRYDLTYSLSTFDNNQGTDIYKYLITSYGTNTGGANTNIVTTNFSNGQQSCEPLLINYNLACTPAAGSYTYTKTGATIVFQFTSLTDYNKYKSEYETTIAAITPVGPVPATSDLNYYRFIRMWLQKYNSDVCGDVASINTQINFHYLTPVIFDLGTQTMTFTVSLIDASPYYATVGACAGTCASLPWVGYANALVTSANLTYTAATTQVKTSNGIYYVHSAPVVTSIGRTSFASYNVTRYPDFPSPTGGTNGWNTFAIIASPTRYRNDYWFYADLITITNPADGVNNFKIQSYLDANGAYATANLHTIYEISGGVVTTPIGGCP